jgi:hypothetical protein
LAEHYTRRVAEKLRPAMLAGAKQIAQRLAFPDDAADGHTLPRKEFLSFVQRKSYEDPLYLGKVLESLAPPAIPGPDGTMLRSEIGLDNFLELVKEARPDVYAQVMLAEPG